ncbi:MAG: type II toxin-antitoxin system prevent-host-death family antitoxin [Thiocapsa sp.]|nr:type II toxin-antitoxin system prevent-host-death family antitoxin [Thiocapsa sp.]MCG6984777.1 type II toxin-antitoxin system prevent-host-death family antitoxin [Thiocapsa sp.]
MAGTILNLCEANPSLSEPGERAAAGKEIVIARAGLPLAKPVPLDRSSERGRPRGWEGKVRSADGFDASLSEITPTDQTGCRRTA